MVNKRLIQIANRIGNKTLDNLERLPKLESRNEFVLEGLPDIVQENPTRYIFVPEKGVVISRRIDLHNRDWEQAIRTMQDHDLILPRVDHFTQHYVNLKEAAAGDRVLYNASGNEMDQAQVEEDWNYISSTNREAFVKNKFNFWLDAYISQILPNGVVLLETNNRIVKNKKISDTTVRFNPMKDSSYVDLFFEETSGFPTSISSISKYVQGENLYYWPPFQGRAATASVDTDRSHLDFQRRPNEHHAIISCAEVGSMGARI